MRGFCFGVVIPLLLVCLCYGAPTCHLGPPVYCTSPNATLTQELSCLKCDILKLSQMTTRLQLRTSIATSYNRKKGFVAGNTHCNTFTVIQPIIRTRSAFNKTAWTMLPLNMKLKADLSFMEDFSRTLTHINMAVYATSTDSQAKRNLELVKTDLLSLKTAARKAVKRAEKFGSSSNGQTLSQAPTAVQAQLGGSAALVNCVLNELYAATLRFKVNFYYLKQNI